MLSIAHAVTGAFLATKLGNPYLAAPLCIGLHFLEDFVPHWDVGTGITKKKKSKKAAFLQELLIDFPLSIALVYFIFGYGRPFSILPWIGWFFTLLPDFIEFPRLFLNVRFPIIDHIHAIHKSVHRSTPNIFVGLTPQLILILMVYLFV